MPFPNKNFRQTATVWRLQGFDGYGKPIFSSPETRPCRWQQGSELFMDSDGTQQVSAAAVYIDDATVKVGDFLFEGTEPHTNSEPDPTIIRNAWSIKRVQRSPRLRASGSLTKVLL